MRELTENEKMFVENALIESESYDIVEDDEGEARVALKNKKRFVRLPFFLRAPFWATLFLVLPLPVVALFMYGIYRAESIIGKDNLDSLSKKGFSPDAVSQLNAVGFGDVQTILSLYENRGLIIAGLFTFGVVSAAVIMLLSYVIKFFVQRRQNASENLSPELVEDSEISENLHNLDDQDKYDLVSNREEEKQ